VTSRTVSVAFVRAAVDSAGHRGIDVTPVLTGAGISPALLADDRARFTPAQITAFVRELGRLSDDELFGMGPGPVARGTFRFLCYALISAPDLAAVFTRLAEFGQVVPALPPLTITVAGDVARVESDPSRLDDPGHLLSDFLLVLTHRFTGWLVGRRIRLTVVELPYPQPDNAAEYDLIFGAPLRFDAPRPAFEFSAALLSLPIIRAEAELIDYLRHSPADLLARRDYGTTLADQARRIVERGLRGEWPDTDAVAARLSISPQHLRRRLREEGTSLSAIRDDVLRDAAVAALTRGDPVETIARRLGFSEASAFRRAFRRWTGAAPSDYRPAGAPRTRR
jgi:AraC-like DNA-binding protein